MGRVYEEIDDRMAAFLKAQPVFFVATAPLAADGHLNVSPKGLAGCFAVLGPRRVAYLDLTGSGVETIAHLRENGRVVLMFCAFSGKARIVRLHGRGTAHLLGTPGFEALAPCFPSIAGARSVIELEVERVADSCGWGVPVLRYEDQRDELMEWAERKGDDRLAAYWHDRNATSIDGLPGSG